MAIITKEVVKSDWLDIPAGTTTHDALIDRFIDAVEVEIKNICNQPIDQETVTRYVSGTGKSLLTLPYSVPVTLTTIETRDDPEDSWTAVTGGVALINEGLSQLYLANKFTGAYYKLTLSVGYSTMPADIQTCAYEMAKELYYETPFAADAERFGVSAVTNTDSGIAISRAILAMRPKVKERLAPYTMYFI